QALSPMPSSIPATWAGPNRSANCTAVVAAGVATAESASPAVSARRRSNPVQNSAPHICACATATRNCPADRPRSRCLISPTASSNAAAPLNPAPFVVWDYWYSNYGGTPVCTVFDNTYRAIDKWQSIQTQNGGG